MFIASTRPSNVSKSRRFVDMCRHTPTWQRGPTQNRNVVGSTPTGGTNHSLADVPSRRGASFKRKRLQVRILSSVPIELRDGESSRRVPAPVSKTERALRGMGARTSALRHIRQCSNWKDVQTPNLQDKRSIRFCRAIVPGDVGEWLKPASWKGAGAVKAVSRRSESCHLRQ